MMKPKVRMTQWTLCTIILCVRDSIVLAMLLSTPALVGLLVILCLAYLYYSYIYKPLQYFKEIGIRGPKPLPLLGNYGLLRKYNGDLRTFSNHIGSEYGPVAGVFFGPVQVYVIADMDLVKEITVKHFDKFADRLNQRGILVTRVDGEIYDGVIASRGDEWKKRRRILTPAFSANKMKMMEPLIKESTSRLAEKISAIAENGETVDALQLYNKMTMEVILSTAFGRAVDVQGGKGGKLFESAIAVFGAFAPPKENEPVNVFRILQFLPLAIPFLETLVQRLVDHLEAGRAMHFLSKSAAKIIKTRKMESNNTASRRDLLQLMIDASDSETQEGLKNGEIIVDTVGFMLAGYETTSTALAFTTYLLAVNPDVQERLANEITEYFEDNPDKSMYDASHELQYLDMVIEETLRIYSPAPLITRYCNEDCVLNGVQFKKGALVILNIDTIHNDPTAWPDPDVFNPDRFTPEEKAKRHPCAYLAFGYGPRNCIGMRFALLEAKMALIETVSKFKIVLAPDTKVPLEVVTAATLKPKYGVFVKYELRSSV